MTRVNPPCPFCGSDVFARVGGRASMSPYWRCRSCSSIMQRPLPDRRDIADYYESYLDHKASMNPGYLDEASYAALSRERDLTFVEIGFDVRRIEEGRNVEIGCANGLFIKYLADRGSTHSMALDISESLIQAARALPGTMNAEFLVGSIDLLDDRSCDNLFMFNVLEHAEDPSVLMRHAARALSPGGSLVAELPVAGLVARLFSKSWRHLMPGEHLALPSPRALRRMAREAGFRLAGTTRFGSGFSAGSVPSCVKRPLDWLAKRLCYGDRMCVHLTLR